MIVIPGWMAILIGCILITLIIVFGATIYYYHSIDKSNDEVLKSVDDVCKINDKLINNTDKLIDNYDKQFKIFSEQMKLLKSIIDKSNEIVDLQGKEIDTLSKRIEALNSLVDMDHESIMKLSAHNISLGEDLEKKSETNILETDVETLKKQEEE